MGKPRQLKLLGDQLVAVDENQTARVERHRPSPRGANHMVLTDIHGMPRLGPTTIVKDRDMIEYALDTQCSILHVQPKSAIEQDDFVKLAKAVDPHIEATGGFGTPQQWVARSRPSGSSPHRLVKPFASRLS